MNIIKKAATDTRGKKYFVVESTERGLTEEEAMKVQNDCGYSSMGYGFYKYQVKEENKKYYTSWNCYLNAD